MTLNKRRAIAQLEQARLHLERNEWAQVEELVKPVREAGFTELAVFSLLGEALRQLGRRDEARAVLQAGLAEHAGAAELEARLGCVLLDQDEPAKAIEQLARAQKKLPRDPQVLTSYATALLRVGKAEAAEAQLARALLVGAGPDARLVLATVKVRRAQFDDADRIAAQVEGLGVAALEWPARALRADIKLMRGDAAGALAAYQAIEKAGQLQPWQVAHVAWAAALTGADSVADQLMTTRLAQSPGADELLLFANIANLRGESARALEWLERAWSMVKAPEPAWVFDFLNAKGRALRLAGKTAEAKEALTQSSAMAEAELPKVGAPPFIELGHLAAEGGEFEQADAHFRRALELDPQDPEATRALELTQRRLGWRQSIEASAEEKIAQARAEAEAVKRRFVTRETEVEKLKREIAQLKSERAQAEREAERLTAEAAAERRRLAEANRRQLQAELEQRETDIEAKTLENLEGVFGTRRDACPETIWQLLLVAERNFQQSLYNEFHPAGVAVLFSGAFERSLGELFAQNFDRWLDREKLRTRFLEDGVRERRGGRVEYFDRFFDWFDREQNARPPSLGEISRVLEKRREPYLAPFAKFLATSFSLDEKFWDEFSKFVTWGKETLRDPVAHGNIEIEYEGLKQFRERLLFEFAGEKPGALPRLMRARKKT
ncbi:MAG: tetratricopeptide repeat protein [Archangium sp.]|nr:tetratricopeptide repeat protein [Archangium sp.]